jgi:hypothetical protein
MAKEGGYGLSDLKMEDKFVAKKEFKAIINATTSFGKKSS